MGVPDLIHFALFALVDGRDETCTTPVPSRPRNRTPRLAKRPPRSFPHTHHAREDVHDDLHVHRRRAARRRRARGRFPEDRRERGDDDDDDDDDASMPSAVIRTNTFDLG